VALQHAGNATTSATKPSHVAEPQVTGGPGVTAGAPPVLTALPPVALPPVPPPPPAPPPLVDASGVGCAGVSLLLQAPITNRVETPAKAIPSER